MEYQRCIRNGQADTGFAPANNLNVLNFLVGNGDISAPEFLAPFGKAPSQHQRQFQAAMPVFRKGYTLAHTQQPGLGATIQWQNMLAQAKTNVRPPQSIYITACIFTQRLRQDRTTGRDSVPFCLGLH